MGGVHEGAGRATMEEIERITDQVGGWLGKREGRYLYALARIVAKRAVVVEIGSYKGKSTIWLAKGCQAAGGKVYAVDPHTTSSQEVHNANTSTEGVFKHNIRTANVESLVDPVVQTSMESVKGWNLPIDLLWIDADHSYENVHNDFFFWEPHVVDGGIIALHDTYYDGVRQVVEEEILSDDKFKVLGQVDSTFAVQKVSSLSVLDRVKRASTMRLRRIFNKARVERRHWRALPRKALRGLSVPSWK